MNYTIVDGSDSMKTEEIARLLGGTNITETTRKSAEELLAASHSNNSENRPEHEVVSQG